MPAVEQREMSASSAISGGISSTVAPVCQEESFRTFALTGPPLPGTSPIAGVRRDSFRSGVQGRRLDYWICWAARHAYRALLSALRPGSPGGLADRPPVPPATLGRVRLRTTGRGRCPVDPGNLGVRCPGVPPGHGTARSGTAARPAKRAGP